MRGPRARGSARPPTPAPEGDREEQGHPNIKNINDTLPGAARPDGAATKRRRQPGRAGPEQCRKHPQGSARRGFAPAPPPPTTMQGIAPVATAEETNTQQP
jgi:hypothetical protein